MDNNTATLLGVLVGGLLSLAGVVLQASRQARIEREKWERERVAEWDTSTRSAVIDFTKKIAAGVQLGVWLTWYARFDQPGVTERKLIEYDRDMKALQVEIVGARVTLAALDDELHDRLTPLVDELYEMDRKVGQATAFFRESPEECLKQLSKCFDSAYALEVTLVERLSGLIELKQRKMGSHPKISSRT